MTWIFLKLSSNIINDAVFQSQGPTLILIELSRQSNASSVLLVILRARRLSTGASSSHFLAISLPTLVHNNSKTKSSFYTGRARRDWKEGAGTWTFADRLNLRMLSWVSLFQFSPNLLLWKNPFVSHQFKAPLHTWQKARGIISDGYLSTILLCCSPSKKIRGVYPHNNPVCGRQDWERGTPDHQANFLAGWRSEHWSSSF